MVLTGLYQGPHTDLLLGIRILLLEYYSTPQFLHLGDVNKKMILQTCEN